jgi:hypothetical protein
LAERDPELKHILELCWSDAKMHLNVD